MVAIVVDILILGAGWTSDFLCPLLHKNDLTFAATSRAGRPGTIAFNFDPLSDDLGPFESLPDAETILITFPVTENVRKLVDLYNDSRRGTQQPKLWVQLGSTGMWTQPGWADRHSKYEPSPRNKQEDELLKCASATILNLSGLHGMKRDPRNWLPKIAPSKEHLSKKGSVHMIHGDDLARCIIAMHLSPEKAIGKRWILTDGRVYDWWELVSGWGDKTIRSWVFELMEEQGIRALPRPFEQLGRGLDSTELWKTFDLTPIVTVHSYPSRLSN